LVLDLLREGQISQGKAAELLGINRYEMLDLMARHKIPSGPQTAEEAEREIEAAIRLAQRT
jgi:predicted HTH domain antitoxin